MFCCLNKQAEWSGLVLEKLHLLSAEQRLGDDETRSWEARDTGAAIHPSYDSGGPTRRPKQWNWGTWRYTPVQGGGATGLKSVAG